MRASPPSEPPQPAAASHAAPDAGGRAEQPVTERVLSRLPGRRSPWVLGWTALLPLVLVLAGDPAAAAAAGGHAARGDLRAAGAELWATLARFGPAILAATWAVPHALWAVGYVSRRAREAGPALAAVQLDATGGVAVTRALSSVAGPVALAAGAGVAAAAVIASWRGGVHVVLAPVPVVVLLPQLTLLWVYLALMLGLFRLGSRPLALEQYTGDRTLGLRPVGRLAFAGFWSFVANFAPLGLLAVGGRSGVDLALVSAFLLVGTFAVFGSLLRIRAQMAAAKRLQTARARALYAEAYAPLRRSPSLEVLARQAPLLAAAEALEKRAEAIHTWPLGTGLFARAVVIATSVVASVVTRLAQRWLGV